MCVAETGDVPSLHVVHNLMAKYPHVPARIFQGEAPTRYDTVHVKKSCQRFCFKMVNGIGNFS